MMMMMMNISDSTSRLFLIRFISLNPALLSKHVTSFANELASFTVPTDLTKSSTQKSLVTAFTASTLNFPLLSSTARNIQKFAQLREFWRQRRDLSSEILRDFQARNFPTKETSKHQNPLGALLLG